MADTKSREDRSRNMAAVKSRDTGPELLLRRTVWRKGLRFFTPHGWKRLTGHTLPGSPDLVFPRARVAVFVDGCFWHGCPLHYTEPDDNRDFWRRKLERNLQRDRTVTGELEREGWCVLRFWEHELKEPGVDALAEQIGQIVRARLQTGDVALCRR